MVQARDIGAGHRGDREPAERRDNDPVHNLAVLLVRAGLVVFRRMLAEITDGELGDGRRCARLAPHAGRVFSSSDLGEQPPRFFARFVGGHHAVLGDRQPFRLAMPIAVLQDIGLHAARLDPQAEPGELTMTSVPPLSAARTARIVSFVMARPGAGNSSAARLRSARESHRR